MWRRSTIGLTACLFLAGAVWADDAERVLVGTYTSVESGDPGPIRASFSPRESEDALPAWTVVFTVTMDTADYVYKGLAEGSLEEGELTGEVSDPAGKETYMFRGEHRDGKFYATHAQTTGGFITPTGDMTLSAVKDPE